MKTPNNFEEKLKKILDAYSVVETSHLYHHEHDKDKLVKDISTLCEEEVKRARISELKGLKMYDCFNEDYTNDPRPSKLVSIRLAELKRGRE